ncbi:hypothetical protein [Aeropyrum camini]|uniref:hypothetical protein n=1 Tax=Aeropyrum camini TaxID=229980 RepID=UPI0007891A36|nr:hypothetical protein [Aeropyrum camini]
MKDSGRKRTTLDESLLSYIRTTVRIKGGAGGGALDDRGRSIDDSEDSEDKTEGLDGFRQTTLLDYMGGPIGRKKPSKLVSTSPHVKGHGEALSKPVEAPPSHASDQKLKRRPAPAEDISARPFKKAYRETL